MRCVKFLLPLVLTTVLSGCSFLTFGLLGGDDKDEPKVKRGTIGKMVSRLPELELPETATIKPTRDEVMAAYNRVFVRRKPATKKD